MGAPVIGIIGSGNIGAAVARMATTAGLAVVISNSRGPATLADLVAELGDTAIADTVAGAAARAEVVVVAVPLAAYSSLAPQMLAGKVVIDAMNYYPDRDGPMPELTGSGLSSSEFLQRQWPGAQVVKALNNVDAVRLPLLPRPAGRPDRTALPVSADDAGAMATVIEVLDRIGFDTLSLGSLSESWRSQPGTPIYVAPYFRDREPASEDPYQRFVEAEPVPVPLARARELADAAIHS